PTRSAGTPGPPPTPCSAWPSCSAWPRTCPSDRRLVVSKVPDAPPARPLRPTLAQLPSCDKHRSVAFWVKSIVWEDPVRFPVTSGLDRPHRRHLHARLTKLSR